ncbi:MAG: hypothetical protein V3R87_11140 [Dehalococcoidia bacterium]
MTVRDSQRAIEPGSTESGDRATLESGLSQVLSGQEAQQQAPAPGASPGVATPEDPLGALLSGEVSGDEFPSTEGLSVGPGGGPAQEATHMMGSRAESLRAIAQEASSPMLRAAARSELRRMTKEGI